MKNKGKVYFTQGEVAKLLGVTSSTVNYWVKKEKIPVLRLGYKTILFRDDVVSELVKRHKAISARIYEKKLAELAEEINLDSPLQKAVEV